METSNALLVDKNETEDTKNSMWTFIQKQFVNSYHTGHFIGAAGNLKRICYFSLERIGVCTNITILINTQNVTNGINRQTEARGDP